MQLDSDWRPLDPNDAGAPKGLQLAGADPQWVMREINEISIEIGALKGALIDAGILTSEQLIASLVRQEAIAASVLSEPAEEPLSQPQLLPAPAGNKPVPRNG